MKKSLLVIIILILAPLMSRAQTPTKSRIETEIEQMGIKSVSFTIASPGKQAVAKPAAATPAESEKMSIDFRHKDLSIVPNTSVDTNVTVSGFIKNLTNEQLNIGFVRVQNLPPMWKTSVCFGTNCYVDWVSGVDSAMVPWEPNESRELVMHVRTPPGAQGVGNIELTIFPTHTTDSIKVTYTVTMEPVPVTPCRTFWFANPFLGEVVLKEFSIANPELFDIELVSDTEYPTSAGDPFQVRFCSKLTDGQEHSTKITFVTDSGSFERDVTLMALPSGVRPNEQTSGIRIVSVSPNPASASREIEVKLESSRSADLGVAIVDLLGREVSRSALSAGIGQTRVKLGLNELTAGSYILLIRENDRIIDQASFNIAR